jgi:hypothetical protein
MEEIYRQAIVGLLPEKLVQENIVEVKTAGAHVDTT